MAADITLDNGMRLVVSGCGSHYEYAHMGRIANQDTLRTPANPSVDWIQFTGVVVTAYRADGEIAARRLVPAATEYREARNGGVCRGDKAGWHTVEPSQEAIDAAIDWVCAQAGIPLEVEA